MEKILTVAQVIAPIFGVPLLGVLARRKRLMTAENVQGLQELAVQFGLPCVMFNACLTTNMGMESVSSMVLLLPLMLISATMGFRLAKRKLPYHNLPMLFAAQETGMLGIPLYMILFGSEQAYRMGVLDLTQAVIAIPTIALLTAAAGEKPGPVEILKKVFSSPLMLMSLLGLALNFSGVGAVLERVGLLPVLTETTTFLAEPVSALMIFSVGYNFTMDANRRKRIFQISGLHLAVFTLLCLVIQGGLCLVPQVDAMTRWAIVLYCYLPASYLAPGLGHSEEDAAVASGVCSVLTLVGMLVFCVMAGIVA